MSSASEITAETLVTLGVSEAKIKNKIVAEYRQWIRHMRMAGELDVALDAALEIVHSDRRFIEGWQIADLYLTIASLYWGRRSFSRSLTAVCCALLTRPMVVGRPLKHLLHLREVR